VTIIACGALAKTVRQIAAKRGWNVHVRTVPASLHNNPRHIVPSVQRLATAAARAGHHVVLAYADCGSYGGLDELCAGLGIARLGGLHCFDVFAGPDRVRSALEAEPGTYLLTDYLVATFRRSVLVPLGLEAHPDLWPDYFGHYSRLVWLTQATEPLGLGSPASFPDPTLAAQAEAIAARFGLPLTVIATGTSRMEHELAALVGAV
jgi:hypothetical protein